jgi:hypothetical protein
LCDAAMWGNLVRGDGLEGTVVYWLAHGNPGLIRSDLLPCGFWFFVEPFMLDGLLGGESVVRVVGEELAEKLVAL